MLAAVVSFPATPLLAGFEDCNGNGLDDAEDIALGISEDCQADGVPDECQVEIATRLYQHDTDSLTGAVGTDLGNTQTICWMSNHIVEPGAETINGIEIAYGVMEVGRAITLGVWSDPDGDGIPFDAELVAFVETEVVSPWQPLTPINVEIPETFLGKPGTSFFIGAFVENALVAPASFPATFDAESTANASYWIATLAPFDPDDVTANADEFDLLGNLFADFPSADWVIRGTFCSSGRCGESGDVNENGVPDECDPDCNGNGVPDDYDILFGGISDCNGNLVPDSCELDGADCDGDGILDVCAATASGLAGQYFANPDLEGDAVASRIDAVPAIDPVDPALPSGVPGIDFSVRWTGTLTPPASGTFVVGATHDDGVRIWIDGEIVLDEWGAHPATLDTFEIDLEAGRPYHLRIEYVQYTGMQELDFVWIVPGNDAYDPVPESALRPTYDVDGDGTPDLCAAGAVDCDGNYLPDARDIEIDGTRDCNGNLLLDVCETEGDCDGDGLIDDCVAAIDEGLVGMYYDGDDPGRLTNFRGSRIDPVIDFDWGGGPPLGIPDIANDRFAVRWTGLLHADAAGVYEFIAETDDGVRLWIGDVLLIDRWTNQSGTSTAAIELDAGGVYPFRMEVLEGIGEAKAILRWVPPGGGEEVVPATAFSPLGDLDGNGVSDVCDVDCNLNGIGDELEISAGLVEDCNGNGVPDDCDVAAVPTSTTLAYWRFEDPSDLGLDSGPLGLSGTAAEAPASVSVPVDPVPSTGAANLGSIHLGGAGHVAVPAAGEPLATYDDAFTVEAWVRLEQLGNPNSNAGRQWLAVKKGAESDGRIDWGVLVQAGNYPGSCDAVVGKPGGYSGRELVLTFGYGSNDGNAKWAIVSTLEVDDNEWTFVSAGIDPARRIARFVVDDQIEEVHLDWLEFNETGSRLTIGGHPNANGVVNQLLRGFVDEVWISSGLLPVDRLLEVPYTPASS
ncbi:MAG: PA14 domain-containing protein, partial [Planctomycetota bacterium]